MLRNFLRGSLAAATLCWLPLSIATAQAPAALTPAEAKSIAEEAYIFGMALVEHYKALYAYGVDPKSPKYAGVNKLRNDERLYGPKDTAVVSANNDTIYTSALIDLRAEPMILQVPAVTDRYYSFMLVDMVTDNFDYVGSRATGTKPGTYALTGPGWKGHLPKGVIRIASPSWLVFAIGRTGVSGDADMPALRKVQAGFSWCRFQPSWASLAPPAAPTIDFSAFVDAKEADAATFLKYLNFLALALDRLQSAGAGIDSGARRRFRTAASAAIAAISSAVAPTHHMITFIAEAPWPRARCSRIWARRHSPAPLFPSRRPPLWKMPDAGKDRFDPRPSQQRIRIRSAHRVVRTALRGSDLARRGALVPRAIKRPSAAGRVTPGHSSKGDSGHIPEALNSKSPIDHG